METFRTAAKRAQIIEAEYSGVVSIRPGDPVGIAADRIDSLDLKGRDFGRFKNTKWINRFLSLFLATRAWARRAQVLVGVDRFVPIAPGNANLARGFLQLGGEEVAHARCANSGSGGPKNKSPGNKGFQDSVGVKTGPNSFLPN